MFWCHPLVLPQFEQLISDNGYRLLARRLEANRIPNFENLPVPRAAVQIVEALRALPQAVETVIAGGLWVGRALLSRFVDAALCTVPLKVYATGLEGLTRRERQVLEAVLDNLSNKEIARRLQMSVRTAKFHVSNLLVKHGVRRRADLLFRALQSTGPHGAHGVSAA